MPSDKVTLKDILEICNRLEDKMDDRLSKVEKDVDSLQGFQNKTLGILSVVTIFTSGLATFIWNRLTK